MKYTIAKAGKLGDFNWIGERQKVKEEDFYTELKQAMNDLGVSTSERIEEGLNKMKPYLAAYKPITVGDKCFQILKK